MKEKILAAGLAVILVFTAAGCGSSADSAPAGTEALAAADQESGFSEEEQAQICDTLQAIYDVAPGSSGSSLRTMEAAGKLLDLSEALTDQFDGSAFVQVETDWAAQNEEMEGAFDEAYEAVKETAVAYLANPDDYAGELEDCGYEFTYETHTEGYLDYLCNYIEISRSEQE